MKTGDWILVLADDLTGALEAGAKFSDRGLAVQVTTNPHVVNRPDCDVLVIDAETRHLAEAEAYEVIRSVSEDATRFAPLLVYKKTDSTLRGNIASELRALQTVFPEKPLIYAPAYPEMGRTVRDGKLYVWGKLLHETEFSRDLLNAARESNVKALLKNDQVLVVDAESTAELTEAIRLVLAEKRIPLIAGPAAVAGAMAECFVRDVLVQNQLPCIFRCLVVNGSLHSVSLDQISFANAAGGFGTTWECFNDFPDASGLDRATQVGRRVRAAIESSSFDGMIVFGGDTAFAIHSALGSPTFEPWGEILPGVPLSRCGGLFWITKAGGFGPPNVLHQLQRLLL